MQLEGMFKDITASTEVTEAFKNSQNYVDWEPKSVDAKVFVLTTGFWPPYPPQKCNLPIEVCFPASLPRPHVVEICQSVPFSPVTFFFFEAVPFLTSLKPSILPPFSCM